MAHFFEAWGGMSKPQAAIAANSTGISSVSIDGSGQAVFGIWGGDGAGNWPEPQVYRGGQLMSKPMVTVTDLLKDPNEWTRIVRVGGLKAGDEIYGMTSGGARYTGVLTVRLVGGKADAMQDWANRVKANPAYKPTQRALCDIATNYLTLTLGENKATKLNDKLVGGPMSTVHGLAVHTTGQGGKRNAFETAIYGCVQTWNTNCKDKGFIASAHFAISSKGDLVQIVPTDRVAFAQGDPADRSWISVEVDNNGSSQMTTAALDAVRRLFNWVRRQYNIPPELSVGTTFNDGRQTDLDDVTKKVCASIGGTTTTNVFQASMTRGLSCHLWLDPRHGKPCPGKGMLGQMATIIDPTLSPIV